MISIAVLGYGTVGSGVVEVLEKNKDVIIYLPFPDIPDLHPDYED